MRLGRIGWRLRGRLGLAPAGGLEALELAKGAEEGALQAALEGGDALQGLRAAAVLEGPAHDLGHGHFLALGAGEPVEIIAGGVEQVALGQFAAGQFPLGDDHLLDQGQLDLAFGLEVGGEVIAELLEFLGVFVRQDDGAGAEPVGEGVEADGGLALEGARAGRKRGVAPVGLDLVESSHRFSGTNKANLGRAGPRGYLWECVLGTL